MAHSLFIIFFLVFSYFLISFIFLWSFCKISIIVLKEGATFRFTRTIFRLKIVYCITINNFKPEDGSSEPKRRSFF